MAQTYEESMANAFEILTQLGKYPRVLSQILDTVDLSDEAYREVRYHLRLTFDLRRLANTFLLEMKSLGWRVTDE